ncbi:molybdenum ABC transporter ATP-binding protein [Moraxella atlantae]|uniref:Fe(3+) ions import ATP-binding protein FbpC n=1 Tax=Faucicola atlantae TaxID=34059 RepID=A0A1B8QF60_9GAMM|nr:ATP-binding cassette domain-containing protein [Moraxella atlantae]OBX80600.1 molybdenum ABC transporter ATP-binding protein [Moraxella atlantae]OBX83990.1 molybdenum ABC transporter ATP-binding protein [Moraxella atlantae]OPH34528.1 molybdenum ABC transporter ATP-binding protein [Moraxella atlantae]STY95543.1 Fe(3+) ions import ATP-binding protein FbpC [Moraxella atlantae]
MTTTTLCFDCQCTLKLGQKRLNIDLQARERIVGVFGASGTGKTSLLHAVAGLITPVSGHIRVAGQGWFDRAQHINVPTQQRRVGLVFQDAKLFPHKTVNANLLFGYRNIAPAERRFAPDAIIELLKLAPLLARMPAKLSGGEKQRVALGRALLYAPQVLLLDEPLAALDSDHKAEILPFFAQIGQHFAIPMLYVSHDKHELLQLTEAIYYL